MSAGTQVLADLKYVLTEEDAGLDLNVSKTSMLSQGHQPAVCVRCGAKYDQHNSHTRYAQRERLARILLSIDAHCNSNMLIAKLAKNS